MKKALWTTLPNCKASDRVKSPRGRIPRRTPKRAREERDYILLVTKWILYPENSLCRGCRPIFNRAPDRAVHCHHWAGRRGTLLCFMPWWIPLCQECHQWVTANARAASWLNLMCPPGNYNDPPAKEALEAFRNNQLRTKTNEQSR